MDDRGDSRSAGILTFSVEMESDDKDIHKA